MKPQIRRILEAILGLGVLALAVVWLSGGCEDRIPGEGDVAVREAPLPADATVETVRETREPSIEWTSGGLASARETAVSSRVLARIDEMRVRAGSIVSRGDVVAVLDARDLKARVGEAEEALRGARARLELARQESARTNELFGRGVATQQQIDQARAELRSAGAAVEALASNLDQARTSLSYAQILAPVSGRVIDRLAEPGDTAMPGKPLLRIYDPGLLRVEVPVRESLAVHLSVGESLRIEIPSLDRTLEGEVDELVPFAEPGARALLVKVRIDASDERLIAGMFARVAIPAETRRRVLAPAAAVSSVGQLRFVEVVSEAGGLERRLVTVGEPAEAGWVEILSGLRPGERVAVDPERS